MEKSNIDLIENKLKKISTFLMKLGMRSEVVKPEDDIIFLFVDVPKENKISKDTQIYYIPIEDDENNGRFLFQIVSSFGISESDLPIAQLQTICDAVNMRSAMGTLFIDPEDKELYCKHTVVEPCEDDLKDIFDITFDLYIMTLSIACDLIDRLTLN